MTDHPFLLIGDAPPDEPAPPPVAASFAAATSQFAENAGQVSVPLMVDEAPTADVLVPIRFRGSARYGVDYSVPGGIRKVLIPAGATAGSLLIDLVDNGFQGGDRTIELELAVPVDQARRNLLTHTRSFGTYPATNWTFGCDNEYSGGLTLSVGYTGELNPDGSPMARFIQRDGPQLPGCVRVDYNALINGDYDPAGQIEDVQNASVVAKLSDSDVCRIGIHARQQIQGQTVPQTTIADLDLSNGAPQIVGVDPASTYVRVMLEDPETIPELGRYRVEIRRVGIAGVDLGFTRNVFFIPVSPLVGNAEERALLGTYFYGMQLENAADASPLQQVPLIDHIPDPVIAGAQTTHVLTIQDDEPAI